MKSMISMITSKDHGPNGHEYFVTLPTGEIVGSNFCLSWAAAKTIASTAALIEAFEQIKELLNEDPAPLQTVENIIDHALATARGAE